LGDVDFANDFAMELYKVLHKLKLAAEHVSNDCKKRKHRLDDALSVSINTSETERKKSWRKLLSLLW